MCASCVRCSEFDRKTGANLWHGAVCTARDTQSRILEGLKFCLKLPLVASIAENFLKAAVLGIEWAQILPCFESRHNNITKNRFFSSPCSYQCSHGQVCLFGSFGKLHAASEQRGNSDNSQMEEDEAV